LRGLDEMWGAGANTKYRTKGFKSRLEKKESYHKEL